MAQLGARVNGIHEVTGSIGLVHQPPLRFQAEVVHRSSPDRARAKVDLPLRILSYGWQATSSSTARLIELFRSEHDRRIHPHGPACRNPRRRDRDEAQRHDRRYL